MAKTAKEQATESNQQQTIGELKKQNEKSATEEINAVLEKYECRIDPHIVMTPKGSQFGIQVVSN